LNGSVPAAWRKFRSARLRAKHWK